MCSGLNRDKLLAIEVLVAFVMLSALVVAPLNSVTLDSPGDNTEISGTHTLEATINDGAATEVSFYYKASGSSTWGLIGTAENGTNGNTDTSFSYDWDTTGRTDGIYSINATATNGTAGYYVSDANSGIEIDNIQIPTPENVMARDILDDQGGRLFVNWTWDGDWNYLKNFTIQRKNPTDNSPWSTEGSSNSPGFYDYSVPNNNDTFCYHIRASGTNGEVSGWSNQACAEANAQPVMEDVRILPDNPTINDTVQCLGYAYDIDDGAPQFHYEISGTSYWGRDISASGTKGCVPAGPSQWPGVSPPDGTHTWYECLVTINDIRNAEKYSCKLTPDDGRELGVWDETDTYTYINNSRPTAVDIHVDPQDANGSSTLECDYTFSENDYGQWENESAARFKWYKNRDGENEWVRLENRDSRTLVNTGNKKWFSKDDQIMCSVMVKDVDNTWPNKVNPLYDSSYRNSTALTIGGNANPELGDNWNDANSTNNAVGIGEEVTFTVEWMDEDDTETRLTACEEFVRGEEQGASAEDNISFGNESTVWFYSNGTGVIADSISIKPYTWEGTGNTTNHTYDLYVYEVSDYSTSPSTSPVASVNDMSLTIGRYNKFILEHDAWASSDKRLAFKICSDVDNDGTCENGKDGVYIRANRSDGSYKAKVVNSTGEADYWDPEIKIDYETSDSPCNGRMYCNTTLKSEEPITCSYNTSSLTNGSYNYEVRVYDPLGDKSEIRNNTFYIKNRRPYASGVEVLPVSPNESSTLVCNYTFNDPDFGHTEKVSAAEFKWYKNRGGVNDWVLLEGQRGGTLQNTANKTWFSNQDQVKCSVKVYDEVGYPDDGFVESGPTTIEENHPPTVTNYRTDTNDTSPVTMGENVTFGVDWLDVDSQDFKMAICEEVAVQEEQFTRGDSYVQFGDEAAWFYSNKTGQWVRRVYIAIDKFVNSSGDTVNTSGASTQHIYDIYVYNEDGRNETDTSDLITQVNDISFSNEVYKEINLDNAQAMDGKVLGIKVCIDSNNNGTCDGSLGRRAYVRANSSGTYLARNASGATRWDPQVKINYRPGGECFGKTYCVENVTASEDHGSFSCSYETTQEEGWENGYEVQICDGGGECSQIRSGHFYVNRRPVINWVNLTPDYPRENESLTCDFSATDPDTGQSITNTTYWYRKNHTSSWMFDTVADEIQSGKTHAGDSWMCEPAVTDDFGLTTRMNSSSVTIGEQEVTTTIPAIQHVITNTNTTPVNVGDDLNFTVDWAVRGQDDQEKLAVYICNTTDITSGGCAVGADQVFYQSSGSYDYVGDPFTVSYNVKELVSSNQTYWMKLCNHTSGECSDLYNGTFYTNHRPTATSVSVWPAEASRESTLSCNYTYSSKDTDISDAEDTALAEFRWYINGGLVQEGNSSTYSGQLDVEDSVKCAARVGDVKGLRDEGYVNSTSISIRPVPERPVLWELPDVVNRSRIYLVGYVPTGDISEVFVYSINHPENFENHNSTSSLENTSLEGESVIVADSNTGYGHIKIDQIGHEAFTSSNYLRIENQNRSHFEYYNITGKNYLPINSGCYRLNITPELEEDVTVGTKVYAYNNSYPNNWFNLSIELYEHNNTIVVFAENPAVNGDTFEDEVYYYVPPEIDVLHPQELNYSARQGKFGPGNEFLISVLDSPEGVETLNFTIRDSEGSQVDSGEITSSTSNYTYMWDTTGVDTGNYSIQVGVIDGFGRYTDYTRSFNLEKTPPSLGLDTEDEVDGSYFHDSFNITTRIQDYTNVTYYIPGTDVSDSNISVGYGNDYNWTSLVNITGLADGMYTLNFIAKDSVENSATGAVDFYVDTHAWFNSSNPVQNFTWVEDTDLEGAFNLEDHFVNTAGTDVVYRHEGPENIGLNDYNNESGNVSFLVQDNWNGVENVTFFANDSYGVEQGTNIIILNVTDDHCDPSPSEGTWDLNQSQTALCNPPDQPLFSDLTELRVLGSTTVNITNMELNLPIQFLNSSTGYLENSNFDEPVYIKDNSSVTVWNCTFEEVVVSDNASFTIYNSSHTINRLRVINRPEVSINGEMVGTLIFKKSSGNITNSTVENAVFHLNSTGEVRLLEGVSSGRIDTDTSDLNLENTNITNVSVVAGSSSDLNINDSSFKELNLSGRANLVNTSVGAVNLFGGSRLDGEDSNITLLAPRTGAGESAEVYGNLTVASAQSIQGGNVSRTFPAIFYNHEGKALSDVNVSLLDTLVQGGYTTLSQTFNSTYTESVLYVEGMNLHNLTMDQDTPLNFTSFLLDPDGDEDPLLNDTDDDSDGTPDTSDSVTGDASWIRGNLTGESVTVDGSTDFSTSYSGTLPVVIGDTHGTVAEFNWTFDDQNNLELQKIRIDRNTRDGRQWIIFSYVGGTDGATKTLYLNKTDPDAEYVCVKDAQVSDISSVTDSCSGPAETYLSCPGSEGGYTCSLFGNSMVVDGLEHSALIQMYNRAPTVSSPSPGDGSSDVGLSPTISVSVQDLDGDNVDVSFYDNTTGTPSLIGTDTGVGSGSTASVPWSGRSYNTTYNWFVEATDGKGTTTSGQWTFTTEEESTGGGGNDGTSGGGYIPSDTTELSKEMTENEVRITGIQMSSGDEKELDISGWKGGVYRIDIHASQDVSSGGLNITWSNVLNAPDPTQEGYIVKAYRNYEMDSNFGYGVDKVDIYFKVPKSWIQENSVEDVEMWKYERSWTALDTVPVSQDETHRSYKATTEDLSYFSVIGKYEKNETVSPPSGPVCGDGVCEGEETNATCPDDCAGPSPEKGGGLVWIIVAGLLVIASASGIIYYAFREGIAVPGTKYRFSGKIGKPKKKEEEPGIDVEEGLTIDSILSNPQVFEGREVKIDGIVEPFSRIDDKILYNINDGTGTLRGVSPNTDYQGRGTIEGKVKLEAGEPYLEF